MMCGIIGYVGARQPRPILLEGLRKLEYRGYDSAGIAWREGDEVRCIRATGNLDSLEAALERVPVAAGAIATAPAVSAGIGHTRWATHGAVTENNAHPHHDATGRVRIVLNGIIENHLELRQRLAADLVEFESETDAEVVAHLIALYYDGDLADAVRHSLDDLEGHYAFVAMCQDEPETLVGVRHECPLVVGVGEEESFIASSISAFHSHTRQVVVIADGDIVTLRSGSVRIATADGRFYAPSSVRVDWDEDACDKDGFETFMLKEIHEQGAAVRDTLAHWRSVSGDPAGNPLLAPERLATVQRILIVACGTSLHAGLAARQAIERWSRVPVDVEVASEFRYRDPLIAPAALVIGISQSGETADTLAAMRLARARGATVLALTNNAGSQATREADGVLYTRAGVEMGVAATKTFVAQVAALYAFALGLGVARGSLPRERHDVLLAELEQLPELLDETVEQLGEPVREIAEALAFSPFFLFLGRLAGLPVAMEGALKLKEISYIPTDAYPAGEMKHGPIALLSAETPVVCVAIEPSVLPKLLSNLSEVRARGARVFAVADSSCAQVGELAEHVVRIPETDPLLQVILAIVPLQLLAYHIARARSLNVDQPRNLAKTVTVE
jgi:glutamine---fructose-6-phosphate transaminase (isomerizing)